MKSLPDPLALLEHLRSHPAETEWFEFKLSRFDQDEIGEYVSALANSAMLHQKGHAYLIFGIEDGSHEVLGTSLRLKTQKIGQDLFEHWLSRMLSPSINVQIEEVEIDDKHIEIVCIEPAYYRPVRFKGIAYVRVNSVKKRLDEYPEKERSLWMATSRYSYEEGVAASHLNNEDIDKHFLWKELSNLLYGRDLSLEQAIEAFVAEGLLLDDQQGGLDATNLLALAAARRLQDFKSVANKAPRLITYVGNTNSTAKEDVDGQHGYLVTFQRLLKLLVKSGGGKEELRHGIMRLKPTYPEVAIREFLANALVHQDLVAIGRPTIEIFKGRMVFTNPGSPLVEIDRVIDAPARSRNERLAGLMRKAKLCELRGSGIDRAVWAIEGEKQAPPLFAEADGSTVVTMFATANFGAMSKDDRVRACYQHASLKALENAPMSNASLRERLGLTKNQHAQASNVISDTLAIGWIKPLDMDQGNRNARYVPYWA